MSVTVIHGDCRTELAKLPEHSVHCCVTSPPYWGLRDYGNESQIGLEKTPEDYVAALVEVFAQVHRVLSDHGTLWLNLGDTYGGIRGNYLNAPDNKHPNCVGQSPGRAKAGTARKQLLGIPWRVAFALQEFGWILRQDIIWHKPAPMPASVRDRCTTAHEQIFLLSKQPSYYYDWYAISEVSKGNRGSSFLNGKTSAQKHNLGQGGRCNGDRSNKRSVWTVTTEGYDGAHFAVFPSKLIEPCILAGCPELVCIQCGTPWERQVDKERVKTRPGTNSKISAPGPGWDHQGITKMQRGYRDPYRHVTAYSDLGFQPVCSCGGGTQRGVVLDPFWGSGTTGMVAQSLGRNAVGIELNADYIELSKKRTAQPAMF